MISKDRKRPREGAWKPNEDWKEVFSIARKRLIASGEIRESIDIGDISLVTASFWEGLRLSCRAGIFPNVSIPILGTLYPNADKIQVHIKEMLSSSIVSKDKFILFKRLWDCYLRSNFARIKRADRKEIKSRYDKKAEYSKETIFGRGKIGVDSDILKSAPLSLRTGETNIEPVDLKLRVGVGKGFFFHGSSAGPSKKHKQIQRRFYFR